MCVLSAACLSMICSCCVDGARRDGPSRRWRTPTASVAGRCTGISRVRFSESQSVVGWPTSTRTPMDHSRRASRIGRVPHDLVPRLAPLRVHAQAHRPRLHGNRASGQRAQDRRVRAGATDRSLDVAWHECVDALLDGWIGPFLSPMRDGRWAATADPGSWALMSECVGPTPIAALDALTTKLRASRLTP